MFSLKRLSWSSVFAGVLISMVILISLNLLGLGIGLSSIDPKTEENPTAGLGTGSAIWYFVSTLVALFIGGWIAGRLAPVRRSFDGIIHGLLTWSVITLITFYLLTSAIGGILGGAGRIIGSTMRTVGNVAGKGIEAAAPVVGDKLKEEGINLNSLKSEAETLLRQTGKSELQPKNLSKEASQAKNTAENTADQIGNNPQQSDEQLDGLFDRLRKQGDGVVSEVDKEAMVNVIMARTGKSRAEATIVADNWIATYKKAAAEWQQTKKEAEAKAREVADKAADTASTAAIIGFFGLLLGAIVSAFGAKMGSDRKRYPDTIDGNVAV
ncbi:hypothetical protein ASG01_10925 [Chryseobacterium sp. Leaf180]|nr:hypothetical protein ASG01_10925 [Chryseobacterium sp. Leaf180]